MQHWRPRYATARCWPPTRRAVAAIVDFTFNLGAGRLQTSTLRRRINQRDWAAALNKLRRWIYGGGKVARARRMAGRQGRFAGSQHLISNCAEGLKASPQNSAFMSSRNTGITMSNRFRTPSSTTSPRATSTPAWDTICSTCSETAMKSVVTTLVRGKFDTTDFATAKGAAARGSRCW